MNKLLEVLLCCSPNGVCILLGEIMGLQLPANFKRMYRLESAEYLAAAVIAVNQRGE